MKAASGRGIRSPSQGPAQPQLRRALSLLGTARVPCRMGRDGRQFDEKVAAKKRLRRQW
eukprot:gene258-40584_t